MAYSVVRRPKMGTLDSGVRPVTGCLIRFRGHRFVTDRHTLYVSALSVAVKDMSQRPKEKNEGSWQTGIRKNRQRAFANLLCR